ncbi:MAG: hypothetical protein GTN49_10085 [candidate division Zixibacteria bacterium]|nr:hypothetical protein [candidate division Zixibacteria bacterium]
MKGIIYLALTAAFAAALLASCRKPPAEVTRAETAEAEVAEEAVPITEVKGTYAGGGTDADGNAYACEVEVIPAREVYWVKRRVGDGAPYDGVAIRRDDTFVVGFWDGYRYGVVAYTINPDGSLDGISAREDRTKTGAEKLEKK